MPAHSKACIKAFWAEHKQVCEEKKKVAAADALAEEDLNKVKQEKRSLWLKLL